MSTNWNLVSLGDLGVLRFRGADAVRFLQGQVSNDVERLSGERSQLAGYHNPQGRVIALLRLVQLAPDDVVAVLPRELIATVAGRLGKFVLRAKVKIADDSAEWRVEGLVAPRGADGPGSDRHAASEARVGEPTGSVKGSATRPAEPAGSGKAGEVGASAGKASAVGAGVTEKSGVTNNAGGSDVTDKESADTATDRQNADTAAAFEARAKNWAAAQFEQARAVAATAGELSSAAAQLEEAESVVPLPLASALMLPEAVHAQSLSGGTVIVRVGAAPARWLVLSPAGEPAPLAGCDAAARDVWRLLDIADGEAQVYAATSEEFVAQMLNLDALDAIAFDKGCYTGQEVIARAHYRGRVKRRLQRFVSRGAATLAVGESGTLADGRAFKVVEAVSLTDGRCEFLAVAPLGAAAAADATDTTGEAGTGSPGVRAGAGVGAGAVAAGAVSAGAGASAVAAGGVSAGGDSTAQATRSAPVIDAEVLTLPYPLPE
jgi:folate-binding protein YgfZ